MLRARRTEDRPLPPALARRTGFLLGKAAQRSAERLEEALGPIGIGAKHYGIMALVADEGPASQHALGEKLRVDRTTMTKLVDRLEGAGLAERRPDLRNRRAHSVRLTPAGEETLGRAEQVVSFVEQECFGGLSAEERRVLHALLERLNK